MHGECLNIFVQDCRSTTPSQFQSKISAAQFDTVIDV